MRRLPIVIIFAAVVVMFFSGCKHPISMSTYKMQQPMVKGAAESSRDAEKNWKNYNDEQQAKWLAANRKAWEGLDRVYNPKKD